MWLDKLSEMKKISGKTTEQISEESGIPKGTLNKIFAGQTKDPKYTTLKVLVHCLGFSVDDLENALISPPKKAEDEKLSIISQNYHKLNDRGKTALMEQSEVMASMPQYIDDDIKSNSLSADTVEREEVG